MGRESCRPCKSYETPRILSCTLGTSGDMFARGELQEIPTSGSNKSVTPNLALSASTIFHAVSICPKGKNAVDPT